MLSRTHGFCFDCIEILPKHLITITKPSVILSVPVSKEEFNKQAKRDKTSLAEEL